MVERNRSAELGRLRNVSSRHNGLVFELRQSFARAELTAGGFCAVEGLRTVEEAVRSGLQIKAVFFSDHGQSAARRLLPQLSAHTEALLLPNDVFASAVATETPQGIAALVKLKEHSLENCVAGHEVLLLIAAGLQDPGNLGTMVRSAEAFGATAVLLAEGTVSPLNAKAVRASAGALFRMAVVRAATPELLDALKAGGIRLLAASAHKGTAAQEANLSGSVAIAIGNEGAGVGRQLLAAADERIAIPHHPRVDSLNAAVAASVLLYEAARQRGRFTAPQISGVHAG